jgi:hAT family C-terminal dimerisation region
LACTLEQLLLSATTSPLVNDKLLQEVVRYLPHLNPAMPKSELPLLSMNNIAENIPAIIEWFNDVDLRRDTHKSVYAAVATLVMLPSTTASCERAFSGLRRLKTYLRSTMSQERLNSVIMANAHVDLLDNLDIELVAREFAERNDVRKHIYGVFTR